MVCCGVLIVTESPTRHFFLSVLFVHQRRKSSFHNHYTCSQRCTQKHTRFHYNFALLPPWLNGSPPCVQLRSVASTLSSSVILWLLGSQPLSWSYLWVRLSSAQTVHTRTHTDLCMWLGCVLCVTVVFIAGSGMYVKTDPEGNIMRSVCKCIGVSWPYSITKYHVLRKDSFFCGT